MNGRKIGNTTPSDRLYEESCLLQTHFLNLPVNREHLVSYVDPL